MPDTTDTVTVAGGDGSVRLDRWFKRHYPALGHGHLEKLLRTGRIRVDGNRARSSDRIVPGRAIRLPPLDRVAAPARRRRATDRPTLSSKQSIPGFWG